MKTLMTRTGRRVMASAATVLVATALAAATAVPAAATPVAGCTKTYTTVQGDTLPSVALKTNLSVGKLLTLNTGFDTNTATNLKLGAGTKICLAK